MARIGSKYSYNFDLSYFAIINIHGPLKHNLFGLLLVYILFWRRLAFISTNMDLSLLKSSADGIQ